MQLKLRWFDIRAKYDLERLAYAAGTWMIKIRSTGKAPAGHNRMLAIETFKKLGMDREEWLTRAEDVRAALVAEEKEEDRTRIYEAAKKEFAAEVDKHAAKFELKECRENLKGNVNFLGLISEKDTVSAERYLWGDSYGACLQFKLRTNTLGLGVRFENGRRISTPCPMCGEEKETVKHFLAVCPALSELRKVIRVDRPDLSNLPEDFCEVLLRDQEEVKPGTASRAQQFFVDCWNARGVTLGVPRGAARFARGEKVSNSGGRQPTLFDYFEKQDKPSKLVRRNSVDVHGGPKALSSIEIMDVADGEIKAMA
jgi:hypothetical protein